eukprot:scaffold3334_cov369-Prasinococcus_capsulatus_cf.AAC.7
MIVNTCSKRQALKRRPVKIRATAQPVWYQFNHMSASLHPDYVRKGCAVNGDNLHATRPTAIVGKQSPLSGICTAICTDTHQCCLMHNFDLFLYRVLREVHDADPFLQRAQACTL